MTDAINPAYYRAANGMESIDVIEAFVPGKPHRWAALKYIFRAGKKLGQDEAQDLRKAIWWLEREIAAIEKAKAVLPASPAVCPVCENKTRLTACRACNPVIPLSRIRGDDHHSEAEASFWRNRYPNGRVRPS